MSAYLLIDDFGTSGYLTVMESTTVGTLADWYIAGVTDDGIPWDDPRMAIDALLALLASLGQSQLGYDEDAALFLGLTVEVITDEPAGES